MSSTISLISTGIGAYGEIAGKTEETDKVQHSFLGLLAGSLIDASMGNKNQEATNVIDVLFYSYDIYKTFYLNSNSLNKLFIIGSDINSVFNSTNNLDVKDPSLQKMDNKSSLYKLPEHF